MNARDIERNLVTHRTIHVSSRATLAELLAEAWGHLNASEGAALLRASNEPATAFRDAIAYLRSVGIVAVPR